MNVNNGNSLLPEDRIEEFKSMLSENGASENTVRVYAASVREFYKNHQELTVDELQDYKRELLKKYRPATVNTRIYGINQYVKYQKNSGIPDDFRLPPVRCQQKPFLNNIISKRDYEKLKKGLLKDQDLFWYFVVRFLGATGARVSELVQIKAEHIAVGCMDLYTKGGKMRRIYFPKQLCREMAESPLLPEGSAYSLKCLQNDTGSGLKRYIPIPSAIGMQKIFLKNSMIFPCWQTLWDMTASKPRASI